MKASRLALATAAILASCGGPPEREISLAMTEYAFLPARIEVSAGERVRLLIYNAGRVEHDFAADERGRALGLDHVHLAPGGRATRDWTAPLEAASLKVVCTVPGHEALGMAATLVVVPRAGPAR